jgi:hypothetical protein
MRTHSTPKGRDETGHAVVIGAVVVGARLDNAGPELARRRDGAAAGLVVQAPRITARLRTDAIADPSRDDISAAETDPSALTHDGARAGIGQLTLG